MKVLDLHCPAGHVFEGWFASEDDFQGQLERGLVECPVCGDVQVAKKLSAPRLNLGAQPQPLPAATPSPRQEVANAPPAALQAAFLQAVRKVMASTEDVGERFAEEARRIHYGDSPDRGIRGQASLQQTRELLEEGIEVLPLPIPKALKEPLQ